MTIERKLEEYIYAALSDTVTNQEGTDSPCTQYALLHVDAVGHKEEIFAQSVAPGQAEAATIAELIHGRANIHASASPDRQTYELVFFYGDRRARKPFRFPIMAPLALGEHGAEEANAKGLVRLATNAMQRTLEITFAQQNAASEQLVSMVDACTRNMAQMTEKHERTKEELEAAIWFIAQEKIREMDRSHEHRMNEIKRLSDADFKKRIMEFLPALANTLLGKEIFPAGMADTALLKAVMADLEKAGPSILPALQGALSAPTLAGVLTRGMQFRDEEQRQKKAKSEAIELAGEVRGGPQELIQIPPRPSAAVESPPALEVTSEVSPQAAVTARVERAAARAHRTKLNAVRGKTKKGARA